MKQEYESSPILWLKAMLFAFLVLTGAAGAEQPTVDVPFEGELELEAVRSLVTTHFHSDDEIHVTFLSDKERWGNLEALGEAAGGAQLKVFFGRWCHDSQREIPRLVQIFDELKRNRRPSPFQEVRWFAVDREKTEPAEEIDRYEIDYLPTLVVSRKDKELGRIVQQAPRSLEEDLKRILDGKALGLVTASEKVIREHLRPQAAEIPGGSEGKPAGDSLDALQIDPIGPTRGGGRNHGGFRRPPR